MRSCIGLAFLAFLATQALSNAALAKVNTVCPAFGLPCECAWHIRDCLRTCHVQPRLECGPT